MSLTDVRKLTGSLSNTKRRLCGLTIAVCLSLVLVMPAHVRAAPDAPAIDVSSTGLLGKWRFGDNISCGIDDVRAGNLLTVTQRGLRYGHMLCVHEGEITSPGTDELSLTALCDNGGADELPITFNWRSVSDGRALITIQGFEQPSYHCSGNSE